MFFRVHTSGISQTGQKNLKMEVERQQTPCTKCMHFDQLKDLAAQVVIQYEELQRKFAENEQQHKMTVQKLKEREQQMEQMKRLIEPAIREHERLRMRYNIEAGCRKEAEFFASRVNKQNKELKRQSNILMSKIKDVDVASLQLEPEDNTDSYKEYTNELNKTISDLKEEVASLTADLKSNREELEIEKEKSRRLTERYNVTNKRLKENQDAVTQYQEALEELSKVSEDAYLEYELLKKKYELEQKQASDIRIQNEAIKKQSAIFMTSNVPSQQLQDALMQVEELASELQEQKDKAQKQIDALQSELESIKAPEKLQEMEEENTKLTEEKDDLLQKLEDYDRQYKELQKEYKQLEKKLEDLKNPPPPPPPPPPPVVSVSKGKGFLSKITGKKKKQLTGAVGDANYKKAVDEMMKLINSGKPPLRKVLRPSGRRENEEDSDTENVTEKDEIPSSKPKFDKDPSDSGLEEKSEAMTELHSILHRFKRTQSESDLSLTPLEISGEESDLAKTFRKVKRSAKDTEPGESTASNDVVIMRKPQATKTEPPVGRPALSAVEEERNSTISTAPKEEDDVGNEVF